MPRTRRATAAILGVLLATACAKHVAREEGGVVQAAATAGEGRASSRLLVTKATMQVVVEDPKVAVDETLRIVSESGGRVQEMVTAKDANAHLTLRVPAERLTAVLDRIAALGEERRRLVSSEDVTEQVADLEAELANKRALRERLRALLARAKDVKEVLAVEGDLTRVQTDVDTLEGRLKRTRGEVTYAAADVTLEPRERARKKRILGPLGYLFVGAKWFVTKLFVIRSGD